MSDDDIRVLLVHPALWESLLEWLDWRGLKVIQMPPDHPEEEFDTFTVGPKVWPR